MGLGAHCLCLECGNTSLSLMKCLLLRPSSVHLNLLLGKWALPSALGSCSILCIPLQWHLTQTAIHCLFSCWTVGIESICVLHPHALTPLSIIQYAKTKTSDRMHGFWMIIKWRKIIMYVLLGANHGRGRVEWESQNKGLYSHCS